MHPTATVLTPLIRFANEKNCTLADAMRAADYSKETGKYSIVGPVDQSFHRQKRDLESMKCDKLAITIILFFFSFATLQITPADGHDANCNSGPSANALAVNDLIYRVLNIPAVPVWAAMIDTCAH